MEGVVFMKILNKRTVEERYVSDYICNKCEKSLAANFSGYEYNGISADNCGGYNSKIGDMIDYEFSLCEDCLIELFRMFKISPFYKESKEFWENWLNNAI